MVLQTRTGSNASLWNALVVSKHLWHIHIRKVATSFFFFYYPLNKKLDAEIWNSKYENIDIIVNNAGITHLPKPLEQVSEEEFDKVFSVNSKSSG